MKLRVTLTVLLATLGVLTTPTIALAVIQSLNNMTGQTQSFLNDPNIRIDSLNNIHTLKWDGLLPVSRGGTGANSFTAGSLLFSNGSTIAQDNSNLFWDDINNRLGIGTSSPSPTSALHVNGKLVATYMEIWNGTNLTFYQDGGITHLGDLTYYAPDNFSVGGQIADAVLNTSLLTSISRTFTFPDASGTFGLLGVNQTWSGLNKFEASTNSTIYVGSSVKSGCIALGDSDGSGITYITANNGVLTSSTTKPSFCQ